jgi:hypothetical protein
MVIISNVATCSHNILKILFLSYESFIISIIVNCILSNHRTQKRQRNNFQLLSLVLVILQLIVGGHVKHGF